MDENGKTAQDADHKKDQASGAVELRQDRLAPGAAPGKLLTPAAKRALREAEARRQAASPSAFDKPAELSGPKGAEPTRFGDWERGGIAYDF